nr:hypothetical protein [Micromonospora rosaria]
MRAHRTDLLSLAFGLIFLGVAGWWLGAQLFGFVAPAAGWFVAGALLLVGLLGLVGAFRSGHSRATTTDPTGPVRPTGPTTDTGPVPTAPTAPGTATPAETGTGTPVELTSPAWWEPSAGTTAEVDRPRRADEWPDVVTDVPVRAVEDGTAELPGVTRPDDGPAGRERAGG